MSEPKIYFHVGLGKVASTYLQNKVFNNLHGIHYIPKNKYRSSISIIRKNGPKKYLVSCEMDRQFNDEVARFTSHFSDVKIIILFRDHGVGLPLSIADMSKMVGTVALRNSFP